MRIEIDVNTGEITQHEDAVVTITPEQVEAQRQANILQNIANLEKQFTSTMQMGVALGVAEDVETVRSLYNQIEALNAQL